MIGPPPVVPIHTSALMVCPPALSVACVPFAKVGHDPVATGRSGGDTPPSDDEPPLLEPLEEPLLEPLEPLDPPLPEPDPLDEPLDPPELLEALPASAPEPLDPPPLPDPDSCPVPVGDDEPPQPAASTIPSTPRRRRLRMVAGACARPARPRNRSAARDATNTRQFGRARNFTSHMQVDIAKVLVVMCETHDPDPAGQGIESHQYRQVPF
jgi:hypothetical protein